MCKVSVLIPAYNVERYLRECLDSVKGQTMPAKDIEIICVDDASTDGTLAILLEYAAADSRIQVYCHEKNRGQACGRNLALSHASGEYIYMLDADDRIVPEALEELYALCREERLDVAGFETCQFAENEALKRAAPAKTIVYEDGPVMDGRQALIYCMEKEAFSLSVPTFFIRWSYLEKIGLRFAEGILHEDVGYVFALITRASRIRFLHKVYFLRRIRAKSTMTTAFTAANIEGYLKSFCQSFALEGVLNKCYGEDPDFAAAVRKWQRDIFGRLRQLYAQSEETIYPQEGGNVDEETRRAFAMVKLATPGRAQAEDILGAKMCIRLQALRSEDGSAPQVYICGTGQYAERAVELVGALGLVVKGILVLEKDRNALWGFPVWAVSEAKDRQVPVLMGVSHYQREEYAKALAQAGFGEVICVRL